MSFKITKLKVGKGRTVSDEKQGAWNKQYLEVEATVEDERDVEQAKNSIESLLDLWLSGQNVNAQALEKPVKDLAKLPFDADKIQWQNRKGEKGEYQVSEDYDNPDHKALLKFLNDHAGGCVNSGGWFIWVYRNGVTIGRKKR